MRKVISFFIYLSLVCVATVCALFFYYFPSSSVVVQPIGGMGNQMFQYAAAYSLAKSTNSKLYVVINKASEKRGNLSSSDRNPALTQFNIPQEQLLYDNGTIKFLIKILKRIKLSRSLLGIIDIDEANFMAFKGKTQKHRFVMRSYFESEEFFGEYKEEVKKIFDLDASKYVLYLTNNPVKAQEIREKLQLLQQDNSICMHVRRGDAVGLLSIPIEYQKQAMTLARNLFISPRFYIFSDDPVAVQKELGYSNDIIYFNHSTSLPIEDFYLMSKCANNINSNSTFSWWASYINADTTRVVIAPYPRFTDESLVRTIETAELDTWRKIITGDKSSPQNWILLHYLQSPNLLISTGQLLPLTLCGNGDFRRGVCYRP